MPLKSTHTPAAASKTSSSVNKCREDRMYLNAACDQWCILPNTVLGELFQMLQIVGFTYLLEGWDMAGQNRFDGNFYSFGRTSNTQAMCEGLGSAN